MPVPAEALQGWKDNWNEDVTRIIKAANGSAAGSNIQYVEKNAGACLESEQGLQFGQECNSMCLRRRCSITNITHGPREPACITISAASAGYLIRGNSTIEIEVAAFDVKRYIGDEFCGYDANVPLVSRLEPRDVLELRSVVVFDRFWKHAFADVFGLPKVVFG
jgi:hypothetical protein